MNSLIEHIKAACAEGDGITLMTDYCGRGMYGETCVAISGNEQALNETLGLIYTAILDEVYHAAIDDEVEVAAEYRDTAHRYISLLIGRHWDQLGMGVVYYWPWIKEDDYSEL